ncbi:uncharacterized protein LOC117832690 isoform X1 [Xyrichtys novacula]|uniref:Uncharacterized protein LOC117832690 isoform X1 n=1 Tax=Xyrichtys novacula TaxID=13765 RepID=A0AAV1GRV6_XYRNO|nr:uncharacterized protein LOC117832690 isoform X1 [Xyrichtys novacula]
MPRKSKRSQVASQRWQRFHDIDHVSTGQADGIPQSSGEVKRSEVSDAVKQGGQSASCQPQVSYADMLKRRRVSESPAAGPSNSHQVNYIAQTEKPCSTQVSHADTVKKGNHSNYQSVSGSSRVRNVNAVSQSGEQSVCATRSQASLKYGQSRNQQCTCNSLTFLAFLYENEHITRADLDRVLDKGDVMYREVRKTVRDHNHLTTDELPDQVPARRHMLTVDKLQLSRYGTFGDPDPGAVDTFLDLEMGLSCLLSDVQYALLLMTSLCIAVFRTRDGRYGFFDPHARTANGLPLLKATPTPGTAVMVTFKRLSDMIHRLIRYHHILGTAGSCTYELKPVVFCDVNPSDAIPATESPSTSPSVKTTVIDDYTSAPQMNTDVHENSEHDMEIEPEPLIDFSQCSVTLTGPEFLTPEINTTVSDDTSQKASTLMETQAHQPGQINNTSVTLEETQQTKSNLTQPLITIPVASDKVIHDISTKLSKLSKQQKMKFKRRLMRSGKTSEKKENQKRREREKYAKNETYKAKKKSYSSEKYSVNPEIQTKKRQKITTKYRESTDFRLKQKEYITKKYKENVEFKGRQKEYITKKYKENVEFKGRQKEYITKKYKENVEFKGRQKEYITKKYKENVEFKGRQKEYITKKYKENVEFKGRQKEYITRKYRENVDFKGRQKEYITRKYRENVDFKGRQKLYFRKKYRENVEFKGRRKEYFRKKYSEDVDFRQRQRSYFNHRYSNDETFHHRHRQLMRQIMRDRYKTNLAYRTMHKMRCALKISKKYKQISRQTCETDRESENPLIESAINDFRSHIKAGPTHVCTVCHKASFPNQVQKCKRSNYVKNPIMVSACLKGQYVHDCNDDCRNHCTVPDERKTEWICHTCHDHLKNGSMPKLAIANNLELADIPPELCDLNILERHLIAKCITFAKIIPLPKGRQRAIHGNVVCVPSEVQETVQALPRLRNESQVMRVKLKRRLSYRGHHLFQTVTWSKLVQALHKLKETHPQYEDITIRDEEELCDPTLPDDGDEDEDEDDGNDITMNDDDYDDEDLMEIDRIEAAAMYEAETNVENEDENTELCDKSQTQDNDDQTQQQDADISNGGVVLESCLQPRDVSEEILCFSDSTYSVAPAERNNPVSFFKTPKLEAMAFPVQFPTGENTLDENRPMKLSPSSYFKARLFGVDDRFAKDTNYLFFAQFVTEIHLATSSMSIQLRKGKPLTRDGRKITSRMLRDKYEVERLVRNRDAIRFMQPLRGTPAYWDKTTKDLFAMIRQLGSPTFFVTFSAAEMRWPEVIIAIKSQQGEEVNFEELDWSTKCDILRSNPVTTMRMFDKRVEALYRDLIMSPAQPLGKVFDFFWRLEFQHRGSPHIHGLLWVEGAPVFERDSDKTVCDFVSKHISAQLPDPNKQPELYKKVKEVQIHSKNHSKTCFKSASSGCRFGFPKPPSRQTMITRPVGDDEESERLKRAKEKLAPLNQLLNETQTESMSFQQLLSVCDLTADEYEKHMNVMSQSSNIILKREPKDCWVNTYNPHLLKAWDANIDVQFILSYYSLIHYICTYMCKSENSVSQYLQTLIQNSDRECVNECDEMKAVMQAYSKSEKYQHKKLLPE